MSPHRGSDALFYGPGVAYREGVKKGRKAMWRKAIALALVVGGAGLLSGCALFNAAPVAYFTSSILSGVAPLAVHFDASGSSDPDGEIVSYAWSFDDGQSAIGITADHIFSTVVARTFTVTLVVVDDQGSRSTQSQTIEVRLGPTNDPNAPTATLTASPTYGNTPLVVHFSGSLSRAVEGTIRMYGWDFGDGSTGTGEVLLHTYTALTTTNYKATLTVADDVGRIGTVSAVVTVVVPSTIPDNPPHAALLIGTPKEIFVSPSPPNPPSLFEVTFDPSYSTAASGHHIEFYVWSFGDGQSLTAETNVTVMHTYTLASQSRTLVVTLTVIDDQGASHTAIGNVTLSN